MNKLTTLVFLLSFCTLDVVSKANIEECYAVYDGIQLIDGAPHFKGINQSKKNEISLQQSENTTLILDVIDGDGIDVYIEKVLNGGIPSNLMIGDVSLNALDIAIDRNVEISYLNKLTTSGFLISEYSIPSLIHNYGLYKANKLLEDYGKEKLEQASISYNNESLSIANYFIAKRKFNIVEELSKFESFNLEDNLYKGKLVDVREFSLIDRAKLANIIDLNSYLNALNKQNEKFEQLQNELQNRNYQYQVYKLLHNCVDESKIKSQNIDYVIAYSDIQSKLQEQNIDIKTAKIEDVISKFKSPILIEYLIQVTHARDNKKSRGFKFIEDVNLLTLAELKELIEYKDKQFYTAEGMTIEEYVLIELNAFDLLKNNQNISLNRVAHYLMSSENYIKDQSKVMKVANFLSNRVEKGKNISYYLISHSNDAEKLNFILDNFSKPTSELGLNPLELVFLKYEVIRKFKSNGKLEKHLAQLEKAYENRLIY